MHVAWTQQAYFSWPPSDSEASIAQEQLKRDFTQNLDQYTWHWIGTQYADGSWLHPDNNTSYTLSNKAEKQFEVTTACSKGMGYYISQQESIEVAVTLKTPNNCPSKQIDERFIIDINDVVNIDGDKDRLSLRLNNGNGVMYFESKK